MVPGLGSSPGEGHGNPLQYSCLENPMDRGVWWTTAHRVAQSQTGLKELTTSTLLSRSFSENDQDLGFLNFCLSVTGGTFLGAV